MKELSLVFKVRGIPDGIHEQELPSRRGTIMTRPNGKKEYSLCNHTKKPL